MKNQIENELKMDWSRIW